MSEQDRMQPLVQYTKNDALIHHAGLLGPRTLPERINLSIIQPTMDMTMHGDGRLNDINNISSQLFTSSNSLNAPAMSRTLLTYIQSVGGSLAYKQNHMFVVFALHLSFLPDTAWRTANAGRIVNWQVNVSSRAPLAASVVTIACGQFTLAAATHYYDVQCPVERTVLMEGDELSGGCFCNCDAGVFNFGAAGLNIYNFNLMGQEAPIGACAPRRR